MATRLKPSRINVDNTPNVGDGAAYKTDNDFHRSLGGGDMQYEDFERETITGSTLVIENISNSVTPSSDFTVTAGTDLKPGIEYVLRVNVGSTPYTMTLGTGVTNPNGYNTTLRPNTVNQFKFMATSTSQLELEGSSGSIEVGSTAPLNPTEGMLWYDTTNNVLKVYDGTSWDVVGDDTALVNTKTFYLSSTSDTTNAQAAYDWYVAGKNPILNIGGVNHIVYGYSDYGSGNGVLKFVEPQVTNSLDGNVSRLQQNSKYLNITAGVVTNISSSATTQAKYLSTSYNYSGYYTPTNDGHPTSKRYVDDRDTYIGSSAPTNNLVEGRLRYDTTNDVLKTYDGTSWNIVGDDESNINTKTFYLQSDQDTTTALAIGNRFLEGKNPLIYYNGHVHSLIAVENGWDDYIFTMTFCSVPCLFTIAYNGTVGDMDTVNLGDSGGIRIEFRGTSYDSDHNPTALSVYDIYSGEADLLWNCVKLTGDQTVAGTKTFTTSPVVPSKTTDATNTGTAIATEAQVYKKAEIEYKTQAEYTALLPGAASDGKHYIIYTSDGGGEWQPGVNTLLYYDFENTVGTTETNLAATGSTYDGTYNTTPTFGTLSSGKKYLQCNDNTYVVTSSVPMDFSNLTLFLWGYRPNFSNNNIAFGTSWWGASGPQIVCSNYSSRVYDVCFGESNYPFNNNVLNTTGWHCLVFTNDGTNAKWYLDGNLGDTKTGTNTTVTKDFYIGTLINGSGVIQTSQIFNGYIGCLGFENAVWTATEITDYFNNTKANYGIS